VDAGDFAEIDKANAREVNEFMLEEMSGLRYDVITVGERELAHGIDYVKKAVAGKAFQVVCANLVGTNGKAVFKPYVVKEYAGLKVAVFGLVGEDLLKNIPPGSERAPLKATVMNPLETAQKLVPTLRKEADLIVLLAHMQVAEVQRLAEEVKGIDEIVCGHNPGDLPKPDRIQDTFLMRAGNQGQKLGKLRLLIDANGVISDYNADVLSLGDAITKDPAVDARVQVFNTEQQRKQQEKAKVEASRHSSLIGDKFLGTEICQRCHASVTEQWSATKHATAWKTLAELKREDNKDCLPCHVTGYGKSGGFTAAVPRNGDPDLKGVQCEACHGAGTTHDTSAKWGAVTEQMCKTCHDAKNDPNFDFQRDLAKIAHHE
jgi:2',3'-cyclic-nucleotide 2'-phosphodiesterase (5'-nucleotidase family)